MNGPRHMAPPRPVRRLAALLSLWVVLFAGVMTAACSMAPRNSGTDPDTVNRCAEVDNPPAGCE